MDKRSLAGYSPLGLKELYTTEVTEHAYARKAGRRHWPREIPPPPFPFVFHMASRQACPAVLQSFPPCAA